MPKEQSFQGPLDVVPSYRGNFLGGRGLLIGIVLSKNDLTPEGGWVMEQSLCKASMKSSVSQLIPTEKVYFSLVIAVSPYKIPLDFIKGLRDLVGDSYVLHNMSGHCTKG